LHCGCSQTNRAVACELSDSDSIYNSAAVGLFRELRVKH
jgi:hypothetical protein